MVTLKDIAELTGVSISTVSRALKDSNRISDETKRLVQEAANELMFRKGIVSQEVKPISRKIGLLFPAYGEYINDDPTSSPELRSLRSTFENFGHSVSMLPFELNSELVIPKLKSLIKTETLDGLILSDPPFDSKLPDNIKKMNIPFIIVNGIYRNSGFKQIDFDNYQGMKDLTEYLIDRGSSDFAVFTGPEHRSVNKNRLDGLYDAFNDRNMQPLCIIPGEFTMESGYDRGKQLLIDYPQVKTLVCFCDYIALGAMKALKEAGKTIPDDIRISGFDDISFTQFLDPPLTTVRRHSDSFAPIVMKNLISLIEDGGDISSLSILLNTEIIERQSV